ncbi:cytochrome c oxidase cbb3-type subunit 3 [Chitinivorax tropicus]|uniref:Cbb3-type cytochrome c oxidase subunit n=1 Tax=Chitinivorax tropicus TaxID=714531 RepID=A0A840MT52_9PROT|nr:cytochrome-c oxidase, cbb3-type subunit III [Chitinivorax tropicus]MBB5020387.1 cytochrome c oxidase cbb3-type subunit 3 [Chitinivorax tropicus]
MNQDFVSGFWGYYVAAIVIGGIIGMAYLLLSQRIKRKAAGEKVETCGHVWDGDLEEYNNPMPKWWMGLFWLTLIFGVVYLALYPGLGVYSGTKQWTSVGQYEAERKTAEARYQAIYDKYLKMDIKQVAADPEARQMGQRLFGTYCVQCHGADAKGAKGFPNLTDHDWLYGGEPEKIQETILGGRKGAMPAFGAALGEDGVKDVANYVMSLSALPHNADRAVRGKETFTTICAACHGPDGKGNQAMGAPNLTDKVWLYSSSQTKPDAIQQSIIETITNGRNGVMPPWKDFLGEAKVHLLASYVYGLSNNPQTASK